MTIFILFTIKYLNLGKLKLNFVIETERHFCLLILKEKFFSCFFMKRKCNLNNYEVRLK